VFNLVCGKALWVKGHALNRDAILKEVGGDPSSTAVEEVGLMAVVHQIFGLHESDFRLVYTEYPPPGSGDVKFQFVLIRDNAFGKDAVDLMKSRELPRLPYDIEPVMRLLEPDIKIWRSI
jgi:hypothetical protein